MIKIFTSQTCPKCRILKMKLAQKGLEYEECTDEAKMQEMGLMSLPVMSVDGKLMDFSEAIKYVNER